MRRVALGALALSLAAAPALAGEITPNDVVFAEGAVTASLSGQPGDAMSGREIIGSKKIGNCVACHKVSALDDVPWHGEVGPPLDGVADRWSQAELRGIVADAKMTFDQTVMPSFYKVSGFVRPGDGYTGEPAQTIAPILTAQQIEDVVAFLATLKD